jgi:hypothetical protein
MVLNLRPKCANPSCAASFDWFAGGRMFRFQRGPQQPVSGEANASDVASGHPAGHFWLCERCSSIYTLQYSPGRGVVIQPLWPELPAAENNMRLSAS